MSKLSQQNKKDLDKEYQAAFDKISKLKEAVAPDIMLKFYAYYKQANFGNKFSSNSAIDTRSAFKFNAWMQLNGMPAEEAKREYIELAKEY
ncbi:acyl-CoA-binding protein [uncultured Polaribacter sp.]|uniref:acyl-CoA-binding protein n=1 Tax=uncultured Polaribacter sp. TaxID=174711 RepID=UPI002756AA35|nr:acyl-CoA-binding protein [Polaribacter sp.]